MTSLLRRREVIFSVRGVDGLHVFGDRSERRDASTAWVHASQRRAASRWVDTDDQDSVPVLATLGEGPFEFPVIAWSRKVLMQNPSLPVFADYLGVHRSIPKEVFDTVIIGDGPGGGCLRGIRRATHAGAPPIGSKRSAVTPVWYAWGCLSAKIPSND